MTSPVAPPPSPSLDPGKSLAELRGLKIYFPVRSGIRQNVTGHVHAVDDVDLDILSGETLGVVGESGSGKSTLGRGVLGLVRPTAGTVRFDGRDTAGLGRKEMRSLRRHMQMVFQDPYSAFDPMARLGHSVAEPLATHFGLSADASREQIVQLLARVNLPEEYLDRYPREVSGGQLQRLSIVRALTVQPQLIVLDEPVSALDVSTQAQVMNLLEDLRREFHLTYLLIAHNPGLVHHASDRIAVMYLGRIVESGAADDVFRRPKHPYTYSLLSAIPVADPMVHRKRIVLSGDIPSPINPPDGCRFHPRCPWAMDICRTADPEAYRSPDGSIVHCHLHTSGPNLAGETVRDLPIPSSGRSVA
jgi:oligopeptide transport system ATP-binding protein